MITITRGKDKDFFVRLTANKKPYDLTQLVTAKIRFLKDDGSILDKTYPGGGITVANVGGGLLKVSLEVAETGTLKRVPASTLEVEYEVGVAAAADPANYKDTVYILNGYQVVASKYA